jgi:hypothetical protein
MLLYLVLFLPVHRGSIGITTCKASWNHRLAMAMWLTLDLAFYSKADRACHDGEMPMISLMHASDMPVRSWCRLCSVEYVCSSLILRSRDEAYLQIFSLWRCDCRLADSSESCFGRSIPFTCCLTLGVLWRWLCFSDIIVLIILLVLTKRIGSNPITVWIIYLQSSNCIENPLSWEGMPLHIANEQRLHVCR